jgi:hypothetical protein
VSRALPYLIKRSLILPSENRWLFNSTVSWTALIQQSNSNTEPAIVVAVERLSTHAWPKVKRSRIVRVMGEGSRKISDKTDPAKEDESKWDENLRQYVALYVMPFQTI